jgi:hypothetical protein
MIEQTNQTMTGQALFGQTYTSPFALRSGLDECRKMLTHHLVDMFGFGNFTA